MKPVVVITRFNLASRYRYRKLYADVPEGHYIFLDEDYLEKRFALFEKYTFPSFEAQTDADFRWIVMFHADTPARFREKIDAFSEKLTVFEPWFLDDDESDRFLEIIKDRLSEYDDTGVITVRVDNDDMIGRDFVEIAKQHLADSEGTFVLTFPRGLQYDMRTGRCMKYTYVNNHFMCHASAPGSHDTNIYSFQHTDVDKVVSGEHKIIVKTELPMWVEIVSGTNCVNEIWTRPSKVFVPYGVKAAYPELDIKWSSKRQWALNAAMSLPGAFFRMFADIFTLIKLRMGRILS
ncbi:MAG: putative rhamnosyl transferase [Lachnospiraceae bacterium]|nr:putative rhamnosyl transferase [Lachnospiraceae bacterium]